MSAALITVAILAYLTVGLFVSRAYWRALEATERDGDGAIGGTAAVLALWPLMATIFLAAEFARWFYGELK